MTPAEGALTLAWFAFSIMTLTVVQRRHRPNLPPTEEDS